MKKIIIVGAGIAGLSAGCYARMNGYDAEIFEMHDLPGGLCTAWRRKDYWFDGCIHFLVGTNPETWLNSIWNEVGALDGTEIVHHDVFMEIRGADGQKLVLYSDVDRLEEHMRALSPADGDRIGELADAIRGFSLMGGASAQNGNRLPKTSMRAFAAEFSDPFLREALSTFNDMNFFLMTMWAHSRRDAGWPVGGSLEFARRIERRYLELGGQVSYRAKVDEILVECGRVAGVRLADGTKHRADYVISAVDGHETIFELLRGQYAGDEIKALYETAAVCPTTAQISLGVGSDLSGEPHSVFVRLREPLRIAGEMRPGLLFDHYCFDGTLCPPGKSVVTTALYSKYGYWRDLMRGGEAAYREEKRKVADAVIRVFESRFRQAEGKVEVSDVATPLTYRRYTGAWDGAYMGWMSTPSRPVVRVPSELPGLGGFYMAGQWTHPRGGLPTAVITGRSGIQRICAADAREFTAGRKG